MFDKERPVPSILHRSRIRWSPVVLLCILTLWLAACTMPTAPTTPNATPPPPAASDQPVAAAAGEALAVFTFVEGEVWVEERTAGRQTPGLMALARSQAAPFQQIGSGASVRAAAGARATLVCFNNHVVKVTGPGEYEVTQQLCNSGSALPSGSSRGVTPDHGQIKVHQGSLDLEGEAREQESDYGNIPIILSPRNSALLTLQPTIRWVSVEDAIEYVLDLSGPGSLEEITIAAEEIACTEEALAAPNLVCTLPWPVAWPLAQDKRYFLMVSARTGIAADLRPSERSALRTLDAQTVAAMEEAVAEIQTFDLDSMTQTLLLAGLFAGQGVEAGDVRYGLYAEAIPLYEAVVATHPAPILYVTLGDAYRAVELQRYAFFAYQAAIAQLNEGVDDPAVRAAAAFGMGQVEYSRRQYELAEPHFVKAAELYTEIGSQVERAATEFALGDIADKRCDVAQAEIHYREAAQLYTALGRQPRVQKIAEAAASMRERCEANP